MRIICSLLFVFLFCCTSASYAGFVTHKPFVTALSSFSGRGETPDDDSTGHKKRAKSREETFHDGYQHEHRERRATNHHEDHARATGGGMGIAALVCACTVYFWWLAIIFGAIGMKRGRRNRGLAKAGFIAGIVEGAIYLLIAVAVIASLSAY
jgi:hypothetical protein